MRVTGLEIVAAVTVGAAIGATSTWLRLHAVAHASAGRVPVVRHTVDHRCAPPDSHWSTFDDDTCFVSFGALDDGKITRATCGPARTAVSPGSCWEVLP